MSKKKLDAQGRFRSKTIAFHVSPEEYKTIEELAKLHGVCKREYLVCCATRQVISVTGNPRVFKALRTTMEDILAQFKLITNASDISPDLVERLRYATDLYLSLTKDTHKM